MRVGGNVNETWGSLRDCLLEVADEVCRRTKGNQRHSETWWWNSEVGRVIKEKRRLFKIYKISRKGFFYLLPFTFAPSTNSSFPWMANIGRKRKRK